MNFGPKAVDQVTAPIHPREEVAFESSCLEVRRERLRKTHGLFHAIDVINVISAHGSGPVTPAKPGDPPATLLYDVTGDNYIASDDIIQWLSRQFGDLLDLG